jgi:hypothetical protein
LNLGGRSAKDITETVLSGLFQLAKKRLRDDKPKAATQKPATQKPAAQKPAAQKPVAQKPAAQKPEVVVEKPIKVEF